MKRTKHNLTVLLTKPVDGLGLEGVAVTVARGFARNYLLPHGLAKLASRRVVARATWLARQKTSHVSAERQAVIDMAAALNGKEVTVKLPANESGRLFASLDVEALAQALDTDPIFRLDPIKKAGTHQVTLDFGHDITATVTVTIVPKVARVSHAAKR